MKGTPPQSDEASSIGSIPLKILALLGDVTDEDVDELRAGIPSKYRQVFNEAEEDEKRIYAALCKANDEDLRALYDLPENTKLPGVHNIREHLAILFVILPGFIERCSAKE